MLYMGSTSNWCDKVKLEQERVKREESMTNCCEGGKIVNFLWGLLKYLSTQASFNYATNNCDINLKQFAKNKFKLTALKNVELLTDDSKWGKKQVWAHF